LGGVGPRYAGAKRNVAPWEFLPYNFDGRVHLVGPRFLKWNRLFAHAYLNSRVHSIGSASDSIYISGSALADQTGPTNYHRLMLNDAPTTVPLGLITKEAGAGLSAYFPLDDEVSFDAGVGAAFWQRSNLRIGKEVMTYDTLNVGGLVFNKVLQFKNLDYYLELGFRVGYFRLGMRTYLRSPVSPNRNLPLFVADGAGYSQYFVGNRKLSLKPSVSLSFQVNLGQLGDRSHLIHQYWVLPLVRQGKEPGHSRQQLHFVLFVGGNGAVCAVVRPVAVRQRKSVAALYGGDVVEVQRDHQWRARNRAKPK
jgi:hypothetical protein